ncbi:MAG: helix-turn-helix domain-containing protein [Deltaproteobacteria bacterium]|nr:helix-turn-helix domain-containing protein [Deltaproteobacteria bacterium]
MSDRSGSHVVAPAVEESLARLRARADEALRSLGLDVAADLYDAAFVLGNASGHRATAGESLAGSAYVAHLRGDLDRATSLYAQAIDVTSDREKRAHVRARMGFARYDQGDLESARIELERSREEAGSPMLRARILGFEGNIARASGDYERASMLHAKAGALLEEVGDERFVATFAMDRAITALLESAPDRALSHLDALVREEVVLDPLLGPLVAHYRALARGALGLPMDDVDPGRLPLGQYLWRARRALVEPAGVAIDDLEATAPANAHARVTLELVLRARRAPRAVARALVVSRQGAFFQLGGAPAVMLTQRSPLGRIVALLAEARLASPGKLVTDEQLVARAWPGERMVPRARRNRLHVAIATLRKLGLRPVLERRDEGYLLSRDVSTIIAD